MDNPVVVAVEAGRKYAWWRCGRGAKQPFRDGTHSSL